MPDGPVRTDQAYVESHESEYITPVDAVRAKAMADVYRVEQSLNAAGVPHEKIQAAADHRAKTAVLEFEAKQKEDPIRRMIDVLETSAVSGRDKDIIAERVKGLETQRANWTALIDQERTRVRMQGKGDQSSFHDTVKNAIAYHGTPTFSTFENHEPKVFFEVIDSTWLKTEGATGGTTQELVRPSDECIGKVLKGIGALQPNEKVADLMMLPGENNTPEGKPSYSWSVGKVESVPTHMPDITATLFFKENRLMAGVGVKALEKIVAFPASV